VRLHVRDFGGEGPPLIMLHSAGLGAWMWQPVAAALRPRYHVYAPELRGHGDSAKPEGGYDFPSFAADLEAVLEALEVEAAFGLGHSAGAVVLAAHAGLYPGRSRRLLLIEPPLHPRAPDSGFPEPGAMAERALKRKPGFPSAQAMFDSLRPRPPFDSWREDVLRLYCEEGTEAAEGGGVMLKCPPACEARIYTAAAAFDGRAALASLALPLLLLWGESGFGGDQALAPARLPAQATVEVIAGTSHFVPMEKPEAVAAAAQAYFSEECR